MSLMHLLPALLLVLFVTFCGRVCGASHKPFLQWVGAFVTFASLIGVITGLLFSVVAAALSIAWLAGYCIGQAQHHLSRFENNGR
jgi:hypothetical protein